LNYSARLRDELTTGARTMIDAWRGPSTLVVVTHGENILLMLGLRPREAEVIVVTPDPTSQKKMRLIGRIGPALSDTIGFVNLIRRIGRSCVGCAICSG
jgi:hypothetical protein